MFLPAGKEVEFAEHCKRLVTERYPNLNAQDHTAIIDERSFARLTERWKMREPRVPVS